MKESVARSLGRQHAGLLLEMLLALRMEFSGARRHWSDPMLENRRRSLAALWDSRAAEIFSDQDLNQEIESRIDAAFVNARAGANSDAALAMKRAYLLVCCLLANRSRHAARPLGTRAGKASAAHSGAHEIAAEPGRKPEPSHGAETEVTPAQNSLCGP